MHKLFHTNGQNINYVSGGNAVMFSNRSFLLLRFVNSSTLNSLIQLSIQFWTFTIEYSLLYKPYALEIETKLLVPPRQHRPGLVRVWKQKFECFPLFKKQPYRMIYTHEKSQELKPPI